MEEKTKNALGIILNLYKDDKLTNDELFVLMEAIIDKKYCSYYPYYPTTVPDWKSPWHDMWYDKQYKNKKKNWWETTPYVKTSTTDNLKFYEDTNSWDVKTQNSK